MIAGSETKGGYIEIGIDGRRYLAHRLVWLYLHGYLPEHEIDHKDRVRSHNWEGNLRESTHHCNTKNASKSINNKSGITGVYWHKTAGKWAASIMVDGKNVHLGLADTLVKAAKLRWDGEVANNWPNCNTTSSAYQYLKGHSEL